MDKQGYAPLSLNDEEDSEEFSESATISLPAVYERTWWKMIHAVSFMVGGITFILGTLCLFPEDYNWTLGFQLSASLYVIGSVGFLTVDVLEFFTFTSPKLLRLNISFSATGSFFYVLGSIGFIPKLDVAMSLGVWGFILGSFCIGSSQIWKVIRISKESNEPSHSFSVRSLFQDKNTFTAMMVEAGAGAGAWCFFVGTIIDYTGPEVGSVAFVSVLVIW
eukprot:CAMPEP_0117005958 /NCGR_PEP_ID=MMETSP0472-20121206/6359_1 /TAXON_ID=693140 ORGANISM="Tiarina fusus, Strain LIS" /NCGR_SAMPLE_ID=MMETSP0472 /ASSEMBLY_ACC=CAM_ASM_000603 /LENGTH=219 /DNA_ID=CAMNT_0004707289 /DNA_START=1527 /DNA_END=2183 /DNA_ORIENTATION=+